MLSPAFLPIRARAVGEVIVTAQKRYERLLDVLLSITAARLGLSRLRKPKPGREQ